QIDAVHPRNADAFEARTEGFDLRVVIGNLPIPCPAFRSADAAKNNEQRLSRLASGLDSAVEIVVPALDLVLCGGSRGEKNNDESCQAGYATAGVTARRKWRHGCGRSFQQVPPAKN